MRAELVGVTYRGVGAVTRAKVRLVLQSTKIGAKGFTHSCHSQQSLKWDDCVKISIVLDYPGEISIINKRSAHGCSVASLQALQFPIHLFSRFIRNSKLAQFLHYANLCYSTLLAQYHGKAFSGPGQAHIVATQEFRTRKQSRHHVSDDSGTAKKSSPNRSTSLPEDHWGQAPQDPENP